MFVVGVAGVLLLFIVVAAYLPKLLVRSSLRGTTIDPLQRLNAENDIRKIFFEVSVLVLGLGAFYFTFNEMRLTQGQLIISQKELDDSQRSQRGERFAAAVEQLGSSNPTVQIAGIYGMEAISTAEPSYRFVVDETLATFLRLQAPCDPPQNKPCLPRVPGSDPAVQTAITVLGRADPQLRGDRRLDLRKVNLSHIDLSHGNFSHAIFVDSNLSFADLTATDLRRADLSSTRLEGIKGRDKVLTDAATIWP